MSANKAFYSLLVASGIVFLGLTTFLFKSLPLVIAQAVYICQKTFSDATTLPHFIPLILSLLSILVLLGGLLTLMIQVLKTRRYVKRSMGKKVAISDTVRKISQELNLNGKIDIVDDENKFSFCYGVLRPRICLSTSFIKDLKVNELGAVLLHERYHLENHDPLKLVLGRMVSSMFFFIPLLKEVQNYYAFSKEIAADKLVIEKGQKEPLLSALSKIITLNNPKFSSVTALASVDDIEKRIKYLITLQDKVFFKPSFASIILSGFVITLSFVVLSAPVHAITMDNKSMDTSYCVCPYGDRCSKECQYGLSTKEINYSVSRLYTPVKGGI